MAAFFRDQRALDALKKVVYPELVRHRSRNAAIRVWVPDCSTGEEVYSLAISFLEFLEEVDARVPLRILGTDANLAASSQGRT